MNANLRFAAESFFLAIIALLAFFFSGAEGVLLFSLFALFVFLVFLGIVFMILGIQESSCNVLEVDSE